MVLLLLAATVVTTPGVAPAAVEASAWGHPPTDDESAISLPREADPGGLTRPRDLPNYDERSPEWSPSPVVWPARVLLFPLFVVTEFGLRQPVGFVTRTVDRYNTGKQSRRGFALHEQTAGVLPLVTLINGMRPGFGLSAFADRLFVDWHLVRASVVTDFQRNLMVGLLNRATLGEGGEVNLLAAYQRRNDMVFHGIGPDTAQDDESRFERRKPSLELEAAFGSARRASQSSTANGIMAGNLPTHGGPAPQPETVLGGRLSLEASENDFACTSLGADICGSDGVEGSPDDRFSGARRAEAAYFWAGYALLRTKALVSVDLRQSSHGVRLDIFGRYGEGLGERANRVRFFRYGGELSAFVDLTGHRRRLLSARVYIELLERARDHDAPFAELITLGGPDALRGFLRGRFQGDSAALASLDYSWPIWSFIDANLFYDMGNVFGRQLEGFDIEKLRGSYGLTLRTNAWRDITVQAMIAVGTERWSVKPDEVRLMAGTNIGF